MPKKTMREKLTPYDPAEDLGSDEAIAVFMAEAFQTNDAGYIAHAVGVVARAKGMAQIASQTGLSREQLYRSFSEKGNPTLKTTLAVMDTLGVKPTAKIPPRREENGRQTVGVHGLPHLKIEMWATSSPVLTLLAGEELTVRPNRPYGTFYPLLFGER